MKPDKCPLCGEQIIGVEYPLYDPEHYDGVSEWACIGSLGETNPWTGAPIKKCRYRIGRFCGKSLSEKESEPRYCKGIHPVHA